MAGYKKIYDLDKIKVNIGVDADAFPLDGLMRVMVTRNEDEYTTHVAGDGQYRNVRNNNRSGRVEIEVANWASCHGKIFLLHKSGLQFPIAVIDKASDNGAVFADGCMLSKPPDFERTAEEGTTTYVFTAGDVELKHAGAADE